MNIATDHEHCAGGECWQDKDPCPAGGTPATGKPRPLTQGEHAGLVDHVRSLVILGADPDSIYDVVNDTLYHGAS